MFDENVNGFSKNVSLESDTSDLNSFSNTSIVAESPAESNDSVAERLNNIEFMVFSPRHSPGVIEKAELKKLINNKITKKNSGKILKGIDELIRICNDGYVHTLNLHLSDEGGEGEHHIICIDHDYNEDDKHKLPLEAMRQLPTIKHYAALIQPSLSYTETRPNCHIYFPLSRPVTTKEQQLIIQVIFDWNKKDIEEALGITADPNNAKVGGDRCFKNNAHNDIFAPADKLARYLPIEAILDVEELLKEAKEKGYTTSKNTGRKTKVTQTSPAVNSKVTLPKIESATTVPPESVSQPQTITEAVLKHLHDHLLIGKMNGDARLLYSLHGDKLYFTPRDPEQGEVCRYATSNLFSSTNKSGESFMIIHEEGLLPRFWDKSGEFDERHQDGYSSNHGTYLDYYFHVMSPRGRFIGIERQSDGGYPKGFFKVLVEDIITTYDLPEFDWHCLDVEMGELTNHLFEWCKGKIFYMGKGCYFAFSSLHKKWAIQSDIDSTYSDSIREYVEDNYSSRTVYQINGKRKVLVDIRNLPINTLFSMIRKNYNVSGDELPVDNIDYIPFKNGLYDVKNKELLVNDGRAFNRHIIPWNYTPESIDIKIIETLKQYLSEFANDSEGVVSEILFIWLMLNCQRQAYSSTYGVFLFGDSGVGKTVYLMLIAKLLNGFMMSSSGVSEALPSGYACTPDRLSLIRNDSHATATLENRTSVLIPELTKNLPNGLDALGFLFEYLGNEAKTTININQKYQPSRTVTHRMGFTFDNEQIPTIKSEVKGNFRRVIFLPFRDASGGNVSTFYKAFHKRYLSVIDANLESIFNYAITLDTQVLTDRLTELKEHPSIKNYVTEVRRDNDSVLDFVDDHLVITNNMEDKLSWDAVYNGMEKVNNNKYVKNATKKRTFINMITERLTDKMYNLGWKGQSVSATYRCKLTDGSRKGYFTGLKLSDDILKAMGKFDSSEGKF
jgi:phage/plasmid-associated DNA primase